ncbi:hypothetical protein WJX74_003246 [Apatococcus lobatus]|uniref:Uncharacterized protein n=2 Tax=Apatococcus TaxID=904362 RepID=A0AAW1SNU3_9CHLO
MTRSVLRELEDLRILLRSPRPSLPAGQLGPGPAEHPSPLPKQYADVLQTAEGRINRLNDAIAAADEGSEAINQATRDVQKQTLTEKEAESQKLRQALEEELSESARLREALSQTRTSLHDRLRELEDVLCLRQAEVSRLHEALRAAGLSHEQQQAELSAAQAKLGEQEMSAHSCRQKLEANLATMTAQRDTAIRNAEHSLPALVERTKAEWKDERERLQVAAADAKLQASQRLTDLTEHYSRAARQQAEDHASSLEGLRKQHTGAIEQLQGQQGAALEALKQQHAREVEEVQKHSRKALKAAARRSSHTHHQEMEAALGDVQHQLHGERKRRKELDRWLRSELESREEADALLVAMRDLINSCSKPRREDASRGLSDRDRHPGEHGAQRGAQEDRTAEDPGLIPAAAGSPGAAAAKAAGNADIQQYISQKLSLRELSRLPDPESLSSQTDLDHVQQQLTQRLAKLLQPAV